MLGNVAEWVEDDYAENTVSLESVSADGSRGRFHGRVARVPKVVRGGSWGSRARDVRGVGPRQSQAATYGRSLSASVAYGTAHRIRNEIPALMTMMNRMRRFRGGIRRQATTTSFARWGRADSVSSSRHGIASTGLMYAVKRVELSAEDAQRFENEALYPANIASRSLHVLGVHYSFTIPSEDVFYLVTELVPHGDLRTFLDKIPSRCRLRRRSKSRSGSPRVWRRSMHKGSFTAI